MQFERPPGAVFVFVTLAARTPSGSRKWLVDSRRRTQVQRQDCSKPAERQTYVALIGAYSPLSLAG